MSKNNQQQDGLAFKPATLWIKSGNGASVADLVKEKIKENFAVSLYWLEPALQLNNEQAGRLKDFKPFGTTLSADSPELNIKLEEAYLFSEQAVLHVIATKEGCRWCQFQNIETQNYTKMNNVQRRKESYPVLTRRDFDRFFGKSNESELNWFSDVKKSNEKLYVTEYWTDDGLLVWWLSKGEDNGNG
jgi:hypothetical protein